MGDAALNVRLGAKTKEFNAKLSQASYRLKKFGKQVSGLGRTMTTNFTMPIVAAGVASVKLSLDFQKSMTKIETLVGKTSGEIEVMKDGIMDMAQETAKSPVELAEGLYFLESAGLRGANAMETLNNVAKGSASGLGDMESLAVVAAAAQNAYGEETLTASEALDKFGVMVRTGMFDAQELSNVLGKQLGLASNLGISFDEVGALISTYTATTGDATAATNGLSAIMMTFAKLESEPTKKQAEALDAIGMSAQQVKNMMGEQGLMATMQHLQTQFEANNIPMADFFTKSQALKGALGVLGTQTQTYTNNLDAMGQSAEFVGDAFATTADKDAFKMEQAINSLKVAGTQLGDSLAPVVQAITEKVLALTNWWTGLDKATQDNYASWAMWIATVGPALLLFGGIITKLGTFIGLMKKWQVVSKLVTAGQWLLNIALNANPIGLVVAAIAALIGAFYYLSTSSSTIAVTVRGAFEKMVNGVIFLTNGVIKGINALRKKIGKDALPLFNKFRLKTKEAFDSSDIANQAKAVDNLAGSYSNLNNIMSLDTGGDIDTGDDDTGDDDTGDESKEDERKRKEKERNAKAALENIRRLTNEFNILGIKDDKQAAIKRLENKRDTLLLEVKETEHTEAEKEAIVKLYAKKIDDINGETTQSFKEKWAETFETIQKGFQTGFNVAKQTIGGISDLWAAQAEKEQTILDNKQKEENSDYEKWYERELAKIDAIATNEEHKQELVSNLDKEAAIKKKALEKRQDEEQAALQTKAAKRDKKMKVMSAIMSTAQAVVNALGSLPPPFNFAMAALVGGLGAAQVAAISSTPIPAFADGGIVFGPTIAQVGEYSGASANPEVIAPLNKLKSMLGEKDGKQSIEIFGRISGNDIFVSNSLASNKRLRYT